MAAAAPDTKAGADSEVFFVTVSFKGSTYEVPLEADDEVSALFDFVQEVLPEFPRENCKLIHKGKQLRPTDGARTAQALGLGPGAKLMMLATNAHDAAFVRSSKADPLVKGFAEEERNERNRQKRAKAASRGAWGTQQDREYRFGSIKAEFVYNTPTPYEAEALLQKLATDPGIIEIMKTRSFKVGVLTEMSPAEAQRRMEQKGTPNMDLLGYNMNNGDMIVLRLRTDNTKGFRPYHDLINTLIHELTHNVISPHDARFWKLFGELTAQYKKFHRFWSHGGQSAMGDSGGQFNGFENSTEVEAPAGGFGQILGGEGETLTPAELREKRAGLLQRHSQESFKARTGGFWTCPCGQTHENNFICELVTAEDVGMHEPPRDTSTVVEAAAPDQEPVPAIDTVRHLEMDPSPPATMLERGTDMEVTTDDTRMQTSVLLEAAAPDQEPDLTSDRIRQEAMEPTPPATVPERGADMDVEPTAMLETQMDTSELPQAVQDDTPGLSPEDLAAFGLDGASEWIQQFSSELRSLPPSSGSRAAAELLLRLVQNVISNPSEAKFRRIRAENPKIRSTLFGAGADTAPLLQRLGFQSMIEGGERIFLLRDVSLDVVRLQLGKDLLEQHLSRSVVVAP
jgi:hypothetical protein